MWSRVELKQKGKAAFKSNYWRTVLAALILTALTTGSSMSGSSGSTSSMQKLAEQLDSEQLKQLAAIIATYCIIAVIVWSLLRVFVLNILEVGCHAFLKKNLSEHATIHEFTAGFGNYKRSMLTMMLRDVFLALWFCLFFIPGLVKSYSYMMIPYILIDEPDLTPMEAIKKSCAMMKGNKWKTFVLDLSFIGWYLLSAITFGLVGTFYSEPYRRSTRAALYEELKKM